MGGQGRRSDHAETLEGAPQKELLANRPVVVTFKNKEAVFPVGWARWETRDGQMDNTRLQVSVPERVLVNRHASEWVSVEVMIGEDRLLNTPGLHVYPAMKAELETLNGRGPNSDPPPAIEWGEQIRVTGSGFVAPKGRIELLVDNVPFPVLDLDPEGHSFVARRPRERSPDKASHDPSSGNPVDAPKDRSNASHVGRKKLSLRVWDTEIDITGFETVQVEDRLNLTPKKKLLAALLASIPLALLIGILGRACARVEASRAGYVRLNKASETRPGKPRGFTLDLLLIDPTSRTYSLSRFQFLWWLAILLFSYSYLFVARGIWVAGDWRFYDLSGSAYPMLISLGTLIGAQSTERMIGPKGASDFRPVFTDLVSHGGIISLDRIQQLAISIIAGVMFIWIVWQTAPTTATLPDVPEKILTLMGFSSAGYLAGKFARKAGPILDDVEGAEADDSGGDHGLPAGVDSARREAGGKPREVELHGRNFSADARVFLNKERVDPGAVTAGPREGAGNEFTSILKIPRASLPETLRRSAITEVLVVNTDSQEALWLALHPRPAS